MAHRMRGLRLTTTAAASAACCLSLAARAGPPAADVAACAVKAVALERAEAVLGGRHLDRVTAALDLAGCELEAAPRQPARRGRREGAAVPAPTLSLHVSPGGNDGAAGSAAEPLRTLSEAQARLRTAPEGRAGAEVVLGPGTHFLREPLRFTPADGGAPGRPVTWRGAGSAVVSGGEPLDCQGRWRPAGTGAAAWPPAGAFACELGPGTAGFSALFVAGERQVRARYPNGDPMVPLSGYAKGCKTLETVPLTGVAALERNVTVLASDGTTVVSRLVSVRSPSGSNVTARDTERPRTVDVTHAESQVLYRGTRFDESFNYPYWNSTAPQKISAPEGWAERWRADESTLPLPGAVVKMMHPDGWGSWAFEVSSHDAGEGTLSFGRGGWQEAEGGDGCGAMYVENVRGELDAPGEWWFDDVATTLYFMPPAGWTEEQLQGAAVVAPRLQRAIEVSGDASDKLVEDLVLQDLNVTHTAITYLEPYEAPSGGDWSVHRGAALFVDGAERLTLRRLSFDQVDGNAVFFSGLVRNSSVEDCDFWRAGESAMLVVGSVPAGGDARVLAGARLPMNNTFTGNWVEEVGVHVKQTSCFFKSMAGGNLLQGNVCYNGPRAGFNWNDGLPGGDVLEHNVIFNMVRETGDHGTFNSWDRKEFVYDCPGGGGVCFTPQTIRLRHNMFIGPAGWNVDHDDGSSQYEDFSNVVYLGGIKYRDGVMRNMTGNLLVDAVPAFQVIGFDTDYFIGNTIASATPVVSQVCGPSSLGGLRGTTYATVSGAQEGAASAGSGGADAAQSAPCHARGPGWRPPACQCDAGTNVTVTAARLRAMLRATVGGAAARVEGEAVLLV